jgi:hypothetical protein
MPSPTESLVATLKDRLATLDQERRAIVALLATYGEQVEMGRQPGMHSSYIAPVFPPVPESEKIRLKKDANNRSGISDVIVMVARKYPGLDITQLCNRVMEYVTGDVPKTRDGLRNMVKYLVDTKKLTRTNDGKYFAPEQEAGLLDQLK